MGPRSAAGRYCIKMGTIKGSDRILEAEGGGLIAVGEHLAVAREAHDGAQSLLGVLLAHEVLELVNEAALARDVGGALVEHAADVRRQWHVRQQVPREDALALVQAGIGERPARPGE